MILNQAENIMLGSTEVQKVYLGSELVWERSRFQLLDFIQTTNQQYFNTGYFPGENTRIECEVLLMDNYDNQIQELFGCDNFYIRYNQYGNHSMDVSFGGNRTTNTVSLPYFRKIRIVMDRQAVSWYDENNQLISRLTLPSGTVYTSYHPLWVGCRNNNGSVYCFGEFCLYSFRIYENNSLVMDFVPAKRKSDGVSGMLDTLTEQFYPDENGNGFLSPMSEDDYQPVSALQTAGNLYINTGVVHTADTRIVLDSIPHTAGDSFAYNSTLFGSLLDNAYQSDTWVLWNFSGGRTDKSGVLRRGQGDELVLSGMNFQTRSVITAQYNSITMQYPGGESRTMTLSGTAIADGVNSMYLFHCNSKSSDVPLRRTWSVFYSCQIYEGNVLVRDFIPVRRLSDNALMLYDRVLKIAFLPHGGNFTEVT
jgi:hypothetical protein